MPDAVFYGPSGEVLRNPDLEYLHQVIVSPPSRYWEHGSGEAYIEIKECMGKKRLLIIQNTDLGYYLKFLFIEKSIVQDVWLSLGNPERLGEVIDCGNEWMASAGLFVRPGNAAIAVEEFVRSGQRTTQIRWIDPDEIPEGGNW